MKNFDILDLSNFGGQVFIVGDIHGCFTRLTEELDKIGFDTEKDILLSVGDLVDRGPESHLAIDFAKKPWFVFVRGNHEDLVKQAGGRSLHVQNGGAWFNDLESEEVQDHTIDMLNDAPVILEVLLRDGRKIGVVHADYPCDDWGRAREMANARSEACMWDRMRINRTLQTAVEDRPDGMNMIKGIDAVYFGHTPLKDPLVSGNCHWIDTGAVFPGGRFTIEKLI
jgi:serine/threonine protein phosphatase 1